MKLQPQAGAIVRKLSLFRICRWTKTDLFSDEANTDVHYQLTISHEVQKSLMSTIIGPPTWPERICGMDAQQSDLQHH